jgi:hypothetical protein
MCLRGNFFSIKEDRVAVAGMNRDREMSAAEELMRLGRMPMAAQLKGNAVNLVQRFTTR